MDECKPLELGIAPAQVPLDQFKYLTRLHYCAPDHFAQNQAVSGGPWGEHEMDYILFLKSEVGTSLFHPRSLSPQDVHTVSVNQPHPLFQADWYNRIETESRDQSEVASS